MELKENEEWIPKNYKESKKIGDISWRNIIEGGVAAYFLYKIINMTPFIFEVKLDAVVFICVPVLVIGIIGIRGESVTQFLIAYHKFKKNKRVMHLDPQKRIEVEDEKNEKKHKHDKKKKHRGEKGKHSLRKKDSQEFREEEPGE